MAAWFPGMQAGPALVRTLFGEANPSGRLVVSWPRSVGKELLYYNALNTGRPAGKIDLARPPRNGLEKYVSRYIDEQNAPQFPFGFGLSYTAFRYGNLHIDKMQMSAKTLNEGLQVGEYKQNAVLSAGADITNTGTSAGVETVQCYLRLQGDRKSTRLNSSHSQISYAVFCLKKKKDLTQHSTCQLITEL